jgi:probable F420-dependent oxidoreductase
MAASSPPRFSLSLQNRGLLARPETLLPLAERADASGYDAIWVTDHVALPRHPASPYPNSASGQPPWLPDVDYLEPLTTLAYLAARTRRARVGTSVLVVPVRPPLVTAKMLASLDVLSGGRLIVGVGTGWLAEEFDALGVPFKERGARTDEYLRAFKECWTSAAPSFEGTFLRFGGISMNPKPLQKPHPPIWIGGHGPRVLRRVVELGDGWTPMALRPPGLHEPAALGAAVRELHDLLVARRRDPRSVTIAVKLPLKFGRASGDRALMTGAPGEIAADLQRYRAAGVDHFALDLLATDPAEMHETVERFAREVRPQVE